MAAEQIGDRGVRRRDTAHAASWCPIIAMNISPDRCTDVPLPDDAMFTLPGLAFNIGNELGNRLGRHILVGPSSHWAQRLNDATGAMSRMKLNFRLP